MAATRSIEETFLILLQQPGGWQGIAQFPTTNFRYRLVVNGATFQIWMEHHETKKQWQSSDLTTADFVTRDAMTPPASLHDYVSSFRDCLEAPATSQDFSRDLFSPTGDSDIFGLYLTLKTRVFRTLWISTYSFVLKSVPVGPVDLLDQEAQIRQLQGQVKALIALAEAPRVAHSGFWRAVTTDHFSPNQTLLWKKGGFVNRAVQLQANGSIKLTSASTYVVLVSVRNSNSQYGTVLELLLNGKCVATCVDSNATGSVQVSNVHHVFKAQPNDELSVVYRGNSCCFPASSLIVRQVSGSCTVTLKWRPPR